MQGTDEWRKQRAGKITASRFADAIAFNKRTGELTLTQKKYMNDIVAELLSGQPNPSYTTREMQWGTDTEPYARDAYELITGNVVHQVGFILHSDYDFIGCSPDGLISKDGGIEIKCPASPHVHVSTLMHGMSDDHMAQVQGCMMVTGRYWWDFVSYDPRQKIDYRLYIQRIKRDEDYISSMFSSLLRFWEEVERSANLLAVQQKTQWEGKHEQHQL